MIDDYYPISSDDFLTFEFKSVGPMGVITKIVSYKKINSEGLYNLGFGDKDEETGFVNDLAVTNNQDSKKVLLTVSKTLYLFTEKEPDAMVLVMGSTDARMRLYQMGISNNLADIEKDFSILGFTDGAWQIYRRNITYQAFLARRKKVVL